MDHEITFSCSICGECSDHLPLGGLTDTASVTRPMSTCPSCGPVQWEVMQVCKEITIGSFLN